MTQTGHEIAEECFMVRIIPLAGPVVLLFSCMCEMDMNKEYISSNCPIENYFLLSKIKVDSVDSDRIPITYQADTIVMCAFKGNTYSKRLSNPEQYDASRKVYLWEENEAYEWRFSRPYSASNFYLTLPIKILPNSWYHIRSMRSSEEKELFIYVNRNGSFDKYTYYKHGPF